MGDMKWHVEVGESGPPWDSEPPEPTGCIILSTSSTPREAPLRTFTFEEDGFDPEEAQWLCDQLNSVADLQAQLVAKDKEIARLKRKIAELRESNALLMDGRIR